MDRYDRQLRLWGNQGQLLLSQAHICIIGPQTSLLQEILKNLALVGVSNYTWFHDDDDIVGETLFYKDLPKELNVLNPQGVNIIEYPKEKANTMSTWTSFSIIVITGKLEIPVTMLNNKLEMPPVIIAYTKGLYGYLFSKIFEPHFIIESHPDYEIPNLRIDCPWDQLCTFMDSIKYKELNEVEFSQLPYVVLLYKVMEEIDSSTNVTSNLLKDKLINWYIKEINPDGINDLNYIEAMRLSHLAISSKQYMKDLNNLITYSSQYLKHNSGNQGKNEFNEQFALLLDSLKDYLNTNDDEIMVNGKLPDMESSTRFYNALQNEYEKKAQSDLSNFTRIVHEKSRSVPGDIINKFCLNVKHLKCVKPTDHSINDFITDESFTDEYPILQTLLDFEKGSDVQRTPTNEAFFVTMSYPTASFMGGLVSEEIIKFVTHQYVPVDNVIVYDGLNNNANTFRY